MPALQLDTTQMRRILSSVLFLAPVIATAVPLPRFPAGAVWNQDVSALALKDPASDVMINWLQSNGGWGPGLSKFQIDFSMVVLHADASTQTVPVSGYSYGDYYAPDCDAIGMQFPLPSGGAIEGSTGYTCDNDPDDGEDCHLLVVQGNRLFESFHSNVVAGALQTQCALSWNLDRTYPPEGRGEQCTSVDAAGFPVSALLFNADEVFAAIQSQGDIGHAIRFILPNTQMRKGVYVRPATHAGAPSNINPYATPYGARLRLRADFNINTFSSNAGVRVILRTLKKYGMILADGGNIPLTAEADTYTTHKWSEAAIDMGSHSLFGIEPANFEVVNAGAPITLTYDCVRSPDDPLSDSIFANSFDI